MTAQQFLQLIEIAEEKRISKSDQMISFVDVKQKIEFDIEAEKLVAAAMWQSMKNVLYHETTQ